ncbi:MAG: MFS transporter [Candidatus Bathyarchaeia archaeon]
MHNELQETRVKRNIRVLAFYYQFGGMEINMLRVIWQPFVLSLGFPMTLLGLLESLANRRNGIVSTLAQLIGGAISDAIGRKPVIILSGVLTISAISLLTMAALTKAWSWLILAAVLLSSAALARPAYDALTAESTEAGRRGVAYSIVLFSFITPGIYAGYLGGFIAENWGFPAVFLIGVLLESTGLVILVFFLRETLTHRTGDLMGGLSLFVKRIAPPRPVRGFFVATAVDAFVWGIGGSILFGMVWKTYGFNPFQLGIMSSVFAASWALTQLPIGKLVDRYGCKPFLALSEVIGIFLMVGWLTLTSFEAFVLLQILFGFVASTWVPAMLNFLASSVPENERAEALGKLAAFRGLIAFPAPWMGGYLFDLAGFTAPIAANLLGATIALLTILALVHEKPGVGTDKEIPANADDKPLRA